MPFLYLWPQGGQFVEQGRAVEAFGSRHHQHIASCELVLMNTERFSGFALEPVSRYRRFQVLFRSNQSQPPLLTLLSEMCKHQEMLASEFEERVLENLVVISFPGQTLLTLEALHRLTRCFD